MLSREETAERNKRLKETPEGAALLRLINRYDSRDELARELGINAQLIAHWVLRGRISRAGALLAEEKLGIERIVLRPDLREKDWKKIHGRRINAAPVHDKPDQRILIDLANHFGSVKKLCVAAKIGIGQFHNWKSRGRIANAAIDTLLGLEIPADIRERLQAIPR